MCQWRIIILIQDELSIKNEQKKGGGQPFLHQCMYNYSIWYIYLIKFGFNVAISLSIMDPVYKYGFILPPALINNHIHYKLWVKFIVHSFIFYGDVKVAEWISISQFLVTNY